MAKDDDVQLVESISGIDGTPPTSGVQSVHMHGFVGVSTTNATSNPVVIVVVSNFATIVLDSTRI
jgi:hypothetical protein